MVFSYVSLLWELNLSSLEEEPCSLAGTFEGSLDEDFGFLHRGITLYGLGQALFSLVLGPSGKASSTKVVQKQSAEASTWP